MIVEIILITGVISTIVGRLVFQKWYNHITIYAGLWSITLLLFEARLLPYYRLEIETWIVIISGWTAFLIGSLTIVVARNSFRENQNHSFFSPFQDTIEKNGINERPIRVAIWFCVVLASIPAIVQWVVLIQKFGSIKNALILGNIVYSLRVQDKLTLSIPYLGSLALTGVCLSGIYTAIVNKLRLVAVLPIIVVIIISIAGMGRAQLVIAVVLFMSGYFFYKLTDKKIKKTNKFRKIVAFTSILVLIVVGAELIRSNRNTIETIQGASKSLQVLRNGVVLTPSVYLYLTIHYGVLNQYLKQDGENSMWGGNTFAPIWKLVSKTGIIEKVPEYQKHYRTPIGSNTGTYLREIHADFGFTGVLLYPYILGLLCSVFWFRIISQRRLIDIGILAHLYVIVAFSFVLGASRWGYWVMSLIGTIVIVKICDWSKK